MKSISTCPIDSSINGFGKIQLKSTESVDLELEIAGIGARSHAFIIDWHIRLLLALAWLIAVGYIFFTLQGLVNFAWEDATNIQLTIWLLPAGVIYFLYHPVLEIAMSGRTPGKRIAGVRIVTLSGLTPGTGALLLRNIFRLLDSLPAFYILGLGTVALTRHQVRIGDLAAGSLLVYDSEINRKELDRISNLAMNSSLDQKSQALLLDLLGRWNHLETGVRIRLGEQFLEKTGHDFQRNGSEPDKSCSNRIRTLLEDLSRPSREGQ